MSSEILINGTVHENNKYWSNIAKNVVKQTKIGSFFVLVVNNDFVRRKAT